MDAVKPIVGIATMVVLYDALWLTLRYNYHMKIFQAIQKSKMNVRLLPAFLIYVVIGVALYIWAVRDSKTAQEAFVHGAFVGFMMYAFYDLTNYATLNDWTLEFALTDVAWGTFVCALGATAGFYFRKWK